MLFVIMGREKMIVAKTDFTEFPESCYKCKYAYALDVTKKYCVQDGRIITQKWKYKRKPHCPLMEVEVKNESV